MKGAFVVTIAADSFRAMSVAIRITNVVSNVRFSNQAMSARDGTITTVKMNRFAMENHGNL